MAVQLLIPDRRALAGGLVGIAAALAGAWVSNARGDVPYTSVLVLAVAIAGLVLGARAAAYAYVGAAVLVVVVALAPASENRFELVDALRFGTFLIGSPLVILLVRRAELGRATAQDALDASRRAEERVEAERRRLEDARHEIDAALAAAERERARLEEVAEAIPEPLVVYDDALRGTYGNRATLRLFGRSFIERTIEDWARATEPRDEHGVALPREEWPQVSAQAGPFRRRIILRVPMSGRDVMVDAEGTPIPGGGAVLLLRDVGKEEDERRRLSRFASFVAHELRNPLAVAKARIELARREPDLPPKIANHGLRALDSVDAAIAILERLELYSRADMGRIEASREPFQVAPAVGKAIERLRARGSEREVRVSLVSGACVVGDRQLSEQAITNLLINADRYSSAGSPIHIEVEDGTTTTLRVRDEGPGIADEVADRLFHDRMTSGRGLGLGLYLVAASMAAMGGSVELERRRPGAVFALRWPTGSREDAA